MLVHDYNISQTVVSQRDKHYQILRKYRRYNLYMSIRLDLMSQRVTRTNSSFYRAYAPLHEDSYNHSENYCENGRCPEHHSTRQYALQSSERPNHVNMLYYQLERKMLPEQSPWPHPVTNDHWRNINPVQHIQPFPILHNLLPEISLQLQPWPNALSHDYLQRQYPAQQLTEKNYTILNTILGRGTSSTVYLGVHLQTGTTVAIKELHSSLSQPEIDCLLSVQHDNIIRLLDFWMKNGMSYLVLEKCGCDLRQYLLRCHYNLKACLYYFQQIMCGMDALFSRNIIHRDLKFENLLLKDKLIKISDFGLAKSLGHFLEVESIRCGSPYTMAPEIFFNLHSKPTYSIKSDIWALGVILHYMLYQRHPFDYSYALLRQNRRVLIYRKFGFLDMIIDHALQNSPDDRINWHDFRDLWNQAVWYLLQPVNSLFSIRDQPQYHVQISCSFPIGGNRHEERQIYFRHSQHIAYIKKIVNVEINEGLVESQEFPRYERKKNYMRIQPQKKELINQEEIDPPAMTNRHISFETHSEYNRDRSALVPDKYSRTRRKPAFRSPIQQIDFPYQETLHQALRSQNLSPPKIKHSKHQYVFTFQPLFSTIVPGFLVLSLVIILMIFMK